MIFTRHFSILTNFMLTLSTFYVDTVYMLLMKKLWKQSRSLTATTLLMLIALIAAVTGMTLDPRTIGGVSAWMKPAKFAISTALFCATVAWTLGYLDPSRGLKRIGQILSAALTLEIALIYLQAYRGTTSHFNLSTPLNGAIFGAMGLGIAVIWIATVALFLIATRQKFASPAWGWSLRLGLLITVIGSAAGGLMVRPTPEQQLHRELSYRGGHTVGAPDGGPGLPGVGWSTEHGDLRIPHFLGLHGLQLIPLFAWLTRKKRRPTTLVIVAALSYFGLTLLLTWQALRGESILQPGSDTVAALIVWFVASAGALAFTQLPFPAPKHRLGYPSLGRNSQQI
jgi:hypothetical protein